jgi:Tfp pilus assembly PilM family ATPase
VRLSEPFKSFSINKNIDREYLLEAAPSFAVAAGLTIRRPGDR